MYKMSLIVLEIVIKYFYLFRKSRKLIFLFQKL
jgi:hypothetical protein